MTSINGKLDTCDRCGCTIFRRHTGTKSADAGWTTWDTFEERPAGWAYHDELGLLCPACEAEYQRLKDNFLHPITKAQ